MTSLNLRGTRRLTTFLHTHELCARLLEAPTENLLILARMLHRRSTGRKVLVGGPCRQRRVNWSTQNPKSSKNNLGSFHTAFA